MNTLTKSHDQQATTRILVTGAGGPGAVNLTRSLIAAPGPVFTVGTEASEYYIHLALTDERLLVPRCSDEENYLNAIIEICKKFNIDLIMPNSSIEMMVLTKHRARLPAKMRVPQLQTQEISASKWLTWKKWKEAGIPVPDTLLIETRQDVEKAFDVIKSNPIWFRGAGIPGRGIGGSALPCRKPEEAFGWIEFNNGWGGFIASEFLPGDNLTFLAVFDRGRLMASQGRKRDAYVIPHVSPSGITGAPAICHTITREDINQLGVRCILEIDPVFDGVAFVDFKCDADGRPRPTEINAGRFGTTNHFYTAAGFNFPWLLVQMAFDRAHRDASRLYNVLPDDIYWIRTLDAGPALLQKIDGKLLPWTPVIHPHR
jgi:carbamoyl-phosphate synthase large subunit